MEIIIFSIVSSSFSQWHVLIISSKIISFLLLPLMPGKISKSLKPFHCFSVAAFLCLEARTSLCWTVRGLRPFCCQQANVGRQSLQKNMSSLKITQREIPEEVHPQSKEGWEKGDEARAGKSWNRLVSPSSLWEWPLVAQPKNCSVSLSLYSGLFLLFQLSSYSHILQIRLWSLRPGYLYGVCVVSVTYVALLGWEWCIIVDFIEQALTRLF